MPNSFAAAYRAAERLAGGDPFQAGLIGRLVDCECRHGRLPGSAGAPCGCWPEEETDNVVELPTASRPRPETAEAA